MRIAVTVFNLGIYLSASLSKQHATDNLPFGRRDASVPKI